MLAKLIAFGADEGLISYYDKIIDRANSFDIEYKYIDDLNTYTYLRKTSLAVFFIRIGIVFTKNIAAAT